jgi:hypothetical protein
LGGIAGEGARNDLLSRVIWPGDQRVFQHPAGCYCTICRIFKDGDHSWCTNELPSGSDIH